VYHNANRAFTHVQAPNHLMPQPRLSLPVGTVIDCYRVLKLIGSGGFSLIYLAVDEDTGGEVVIKEFMPKKFARRGEQLAVVPLDEKSADNLNRSRRLFFQEIQALAALRHPNIVEVRSFFRAHNTAYMVMEYFRGKNLATYIKQRKGGLSTRFITRVFFPILDALSMVHSRSFLHLDIKPSNIHLRAGRQPLLLDFGAVHQVAEENKGKSSRVISAGYSPVEQYYQGGYVGPWSDVYAIGASVRACIEGKTPPSAVERHPKDILVPASEAFGDRYPMFLLQVIDWSMELDPQQRPQHAGELLTALKTQRGRPAPDTRYRVSEPVAGKQGS
jgi:serine/threonine protein kinase